MTCRYLSLGLILVLTMVAGCSGEVKLNENQAKATIQRVISTRGWGGAPINVGGAGTLQTFGPVPALGGSNTIRVPISAELNNGIGKRDGYAIFTYSQDRKWYLTYVALGPHSANPNLEVK